MFMLCPAPIFDERTVPTADPRVLVLFITDVFEYVHVPLFQSSCAPFPAQRATRIPEQVAGCTLFLELSLREFNVGRHRVRRVVRSPVL